MKRIQRMWCQLRLWWRASRWLTITAVLITLADPALLYGSILVQADLITTLSQGAGWSAARPKLFFLMALLAAVPLRGFLLDNVQGLLQVRYLAQFQELLAEAALAPHGIEHLEDPTTSAELRTLSTESRAWYSLYSVNFTMSLAGFRLSGVVATLIVARWNLWFALGLAAVTIVAGRFFIGYLTTIIDGFMVTSASSTNQSEYLRRIATDRPAGKELRLFGLTDFFVGRFVKGWTASIRTIQRGRTAAFIPVLLVDLVVLALYFGAYLTAGLQGLHGQLEVGMLVAVLGGIEGLSGLGPMGDAQVHVARAESYAAKLIELRRQAGLPGIPRRSEHLVLDTAALPGTPEIVFDDVAFTYPSRKDPVFDHLSFTIPAGQHVAIVGVNGAGKSTLIKLLCGLYAPTSGSITIGGRDPRESDAVRRQVGVVFQEFTRYELPLLDNILLADEHTDTHRATAAAALHNAAGDAILERLDGTWETVLATGYQGGTDLSGGQWQRIALARALAATDLGARILVLDEPTAALDVRAEAELFDRFLDSTSGLTSILINHRLSTVRSADRILVLDRTGIVEDGSHDELLRAGGSYAQLFRTQAARFHHDSEEEA